MIQGGESYFIIDVLEKVDLVSQCTHFVLQIGFYQVPRVHVLKIIVG